ncbi:MAG TPA: hypothetical protein VGK17_07835 [Propionicimonas sp.]
MDDATTLAAAIRPLVPLRVRQVEYNDPMLTVIGDGWSVALIGEWTWYRSDHVVTFGGDAGAEDVIWDLCGLDLLEILFPDPGFDGDCVFVLSDGRIEARSDRSGSRRGPSGMKPSTRCSLACECRATPSLTVGVSGHSAVAGGRSSWLVPATSPAGSGPAATRTAR